MDTNRDVLADSLSKAAKTLRSGASAERAAIALTALLPPICIVLDEMIKQCPSLTPTEQKIFNALLAKRGAIVRHAELANVTAGGRGYAALEHGKIKRHLCSIRRKLDGKEKITPVWGHGYRLEERQ